MRNETRRTFLTLTGATAAASLLPFVGACGGPQPVNATAAPQPTAPPTPRPPTDPRLVRIISVRTAIDGNLLPLLVDEFKKSSGLEVCVVATESPYDLARAGKGDIVISHYGHKQLEDFVMDGYAEWPRTIFSNQMALVGPPSDPANVRGLADVVEAFKRIAAKKHPFFVSTGDGGRYLAEVIWNAAGRPDKAGWFVEDGLKNEESIRLVAAQGAYTMWGLTPFVRTDKSEHIDLEPLVVADPLLQRILVSIVVKDTKTAEVNSVGARALQTFLLSPVTQAKIRDVRYPGPTRAMWTPAGRHNRGSFLPKE